MNRAALFAVVALSGAAVLMLEILGTRVLGPFYGVSLFLWSALISVTLAALAAGYVLGGRWAQREASGSRLAVVLVFAAVWVMAVPWLRHPLLQLASGFGLRTAVLVTASLLFFPPLMALGMVGPYAVRLGTRSVEESGRVAGDLFAVSTLASVVAALLTGFVLIPSLGVTRLLVTIGFVVLLAAAIAFASSGRKAGLAAVLLAALAGVAGWGRSDVRPAGLLALTQSPYAEIRVVEHGGNRYFLIDGGVHTLVYADNGFPRQAYTFVAEFAADFVPRRGRLLLVGLGGGSTARLFSRDGWKVDAVEIDPEVPKLAERYFRLLPEFATVHVMDGRRFLATSRDTFDAIFFDAFGSSSIPFHLISSEAFGEAKARLARDGVLVVNVEVVGWQDPIVHAVAATLRSQFSNVIALPTSEPPDGLGNVVLIAGDRPLELTDAQVGDPVATLPDEDEHTRVVTRLHAWENRYEPMLGRVLTDDWNPVDVRAEEINRVARLAVRSRIPRELLGD